MDDGLYVGSEIRTPPFQEIISPGSATSAIEDNVSRVGAKTYQTKLKYHMRVRRERFMTCTVWALRPHPAEPKTWGFMDGILGGSRWIQVPSSWRRRALEMEAS